MPVSVNNSLRRGELEARYNCRRAVFGESISGDSNTLSLWFFRRRHCKMKALL
jgi:hypothetical protein